MTSKSSLIPLRIAHHPGVVLEILIADNDQSKSTNTHPLVSATTYDPSTSSTTTLASSSASAPINYDTSERISDSYTEPMTRDVVSLRITEANDDNTQALVVHTHSLPGEQEMLPHQLSQLYGNYPPPRSCFEMDSNTSQQEQLRELKERTQRMEQQIEEMLNQAKHTQEQVRHVEQQVQQTEQSVHNIQQQLHGPMATASQGNRLLLGEISQILDRHSRIQALLGSSPKCHAVPRFFIVLPTTIEMENRNDTLSPSQTFRLYFLCESGSRTMTKDTKQAHEVHMMNHAGYNLSRPKEFFNMYGPYVLTMMHMIKYGATASGYVVPPLSQRRHIGGQDLLPSAENIGRLVDGAIVYLEKLVHDSDTTSNWIRGSMHLDELSSYLEITEGERFSSDLYQFETQEGQWGWICSEHQRESFEWTMKNLKDHVNSIGGTCCESPGQVDITLTSSSVTERFYDTLTDACKSQYVINRPSLKVDCGRFSLNVDASDQVTGVTAVIDRLGDLTWADLRFIRQCHLTQLKINYTPRSEDEDRLIVILQESSRLKELYIGSLAERSLDIINLVVSTREKVIQEDRASTLRTFQLTDENWKPFLLYRTRDKLDHITTTITFSKDNKFDMDTSISMQNERVVGEGGERAEGDVMSKFFGQYGWSISSLNTSRMFSDHLAELLENTTNVHGSRLTQVVLKPDSLTTRGLDTMDRVIKQSPRLAFLWLFIGNHQESQLTKAMLVLERFGERAHKLSICGRETSQWLPVLTQTYSRGSFPLLRELEISGYAEFLFKPRPSFPSACIHWLACMVSVSPQLSGSHFRRFQLFYMNLSPQDWKILLETIDLSQLTDLNFGFTNFDLDQLKLLNARLDARHPLESLVLIGTSLPVSEEGRALYMAMQQKVPQLKVSGPFGEIKMT